MIRLDENQQQLKNEFDEIASSINFENRYNTSEANTEAPF